MTRRLALVGCLLVLGTVAAGVAVAHGNHATARPQVSANGTVVVEQAFLSTSGHLVLHADDGGQPGRVIGHRPLDRGRYTDLQVAIDRTVWRNVSDTTTVWATVHEDDGDGEFEPGDDSLLFWFGEPAGSRISLRKGDAPVVVVAGGSASTDTRSVPVQRVALASRGHVVVHGTTGTRTDASNDSETGTLGRPLGHRTLSAGTHSDVTVPVEVPADAGRALSVQVVVHTDDGDGTFDADDEPVLVGGDPVASSYTLELNDSDQSTPGINTPSPTAAIHTPSPTTRTSTPPPETSRTDAEDTTTASNASGPGFGVAGVLVAVVLFAAAVVVLAARRRG
jgi:hypothetical protein